MPSSRPNAVPVVVHLIKQLKPKSILDIGVGFGKWGHLFREYTDILRSEDDPSRYRRENWQVRIDGIEGFPDYITDMHRFLYNEIMIGDVRSLAATIGTYDVIFLGDIIEHISKEDGMQLIRTLLNKTNKAIIFSTPKYETAQEALCENELERHRSLWTATDFLSFPRSNVATITKTLLIAVVVKEGVTMPRIDVEIAGKPRTFLRKVLGKTKRSLKSLVGIKPESRNSLVQE